MKIIIYFIFTINLFLLVSCSQTNIEETKNEIHISAASSMTTPLNELKTLFEEEHPQIELIINYGSSGTLVNQLSQGAPADVVILANASWMEDAVKQDIVQKEDVVNLYTNRLVLAAHKDSEMKSLEDLTGEDVERVAIGDYDSVPAGSYTKQALIELDKWVEVEGKVVLAKSARQIASYIESKNVDAGFIFLSDVEAFSDLKSVEVVEESLHEPIIYPAALIRRSGKTEDSEVFLAFLSSQEAINVFQDYGFQEIR